MSDFLGQPSIFSGNPTTGTDLLRLFAGMGAAGNQRIPGTQGLLANPGFIGAFTGGLNAAMQGSGEQASQYAQRGLMGAQAQNALAEAALKQIQIPFTQQQMKFREQLLPMIMQQMQGVGGGGLYGQGTTPGSTETAATPRSNPLGGPLVIPPERQDDMVASALKSAGAPSAMAPMLKSVVGVESNWNAHAYNPDSGAFGLGQILPSTARNPGGGMKGASPEDLFDAQANLNFAANYLYNRGKNMGLQDPDWATPRALAAAAAYHGPQRDANGVDGPTYARLVANRMQLAQNQTPGVMSDVNAMQGGMGQAQGGQGQQQQQFAQNGFQPPPGFVMPQQAIQHGQQLMQQGQAMLTAGLPGGQAYIDQGKQESQYGLDVLKNWGQIQTGRGKGAFATNPVTGQTTQSPITEEVTDPRNGRQYTAVLNSVNPPGAPEPPRAPGMPEWTPGGTQQLFFKGYGPVEQKGREEAQAEAFGPESTHAYDSALSAKLQIGQVESLINNIGYDPHNPNWFNTGPGGAARVEIARAINSWSNVFGGGNFFDPNKVAQGEDLLKQTILGGFQNISGAMGHNREAATVVQSATRAYPGLENSAPGNMLVLQSFKEAANLQIDKRIFDTNWASDPNFAVPGHDVNDMRQADSAFYKTRNPQKYAWRAMSQVNAMNDPLFVMKSPQEAQQKFLPGTLFRTPDGRLKVVPGSPDLDMAMPPASSQGLPIGRQ